MSEPKWTPGPWHVTTCMDYWVEPENRPDDEAGIAHCGDIHWPNYETKQLEWEANARLIAAAPDLYAALEQLVKVAYGEEYTAEDDRITKAMVTAALAKATGDD